MAGVLSSCCPEIKIISVSLLELKCEHVARLRATLNPDQQCLTRDDATREHSFKFNFRQPFRISYPDFEFAALSSLLSAAAARRSAWRSSNSITL